MEFENLGEHKVKNISKSVRVYRIVTANRFNDTVKAKPLGLPDKSSIAVLPFVNMSGDRSQDYFCDGLTEEIISGLSKVSDLFVIARNSTNRGSDNLVVWQGLTTVYILSGLKDEAHAAAANVIRIDPKFSLDYLSKILPYKNQSDTEREINALHQAGLK